MAEQKINVDLNLQKLKLIDPKINPKTTTQRLALAPTSNDEGLTVWDSDLNAFFAWDSQSLNWIPTSYKYWEHYANNVKYTGADTTTTTAVVLPCLYKNNTIYRFIANTDDANGYPTEDSFYANFNGTTVSNLIVSRG
jgi:hypothetical protein